VVRAARLGSPIDARQVTPIPKTHFVEVLTTVCEFLGNSTAASMAPDERAKAQDLCTDLSRFATSKWVRVSRAFGWLFSKFEWIFALGVAAVDRSARGFPIIDQRDQENAQPHVFVADYHAFDKLSIVYGGLFRGSVILNYLLGVAAVAFTVASMLPLPGFVEPFAARFFPDSAPYAAVAELACIVLIAAIFCYGQTPHVERSSRSVGAERRGPINRIARRWHERWLEYRLLAERFRYLELVLSISPGAASRPPFSPSGHASTRWYDRYFDWRAKNAAPERLTVSEYCRQAQAVMLEQIEHHDTNSLRRGSIAARLEALAAVLFMLSLVLCFTEVTIELVALKMPTADWILSFNKNWKSMLLFVAVLLPTVSAAIHGILATTEYIKVAESSGETADRIALLVGEIKTLPPSEQIARPDLLEPIRKAVTAFADEAINEASGWRAMLRDKNVPLV
jgi:hypothetical protein